MSVKETLKARCTIRVGAKPRQLFDVEERPGGDLLLVHSNPGRNRSIGVIEPGRQIKHQHYSVHRSPNSSTGINAIKHTLIFENGDRQTSENYTTALKHHDQFACLYTARVMNLAPRHHAAKANHRIALDLGRYDPKMFMLFYSVFVGNVEQPFIIEVPDVNVRSASFSYFRLIVVWSFALGFSDSTGSKGHVMTLPPELAPPSHPDAFKPMAAGGNAEWAINTFREQRLEALVELQALYPGAAHVQRSLQELGWFREGLKESKEWQERMRKVWGKPPAWLMSEPPWPGPAGTEPEKGRAPKKS